MASTMTSGSIQLQVNGSAQGSYPSPGDIALALPAVSVSRQQNSTVSLNFGTGTGKANTIAVKTKKILGGASDTINLFDGSLVDLNGNAIVMTTIRQIQIYQIANVSGTNGSGLIIGNAGTNPHGLWFGATTHTAKILGTSAVPFVQGDPTGIAVTSGACQIKIANNDGTNASTYLAIIAGES